MSISIIRIISRTFFTFLVSFYILNVYGQGKTKPTKQYITDYSIRKYEVTLDSLVKLYKLPGLSIAIIEGQEVVYQNGLGYANIDLGIKTRANTNYRIASLTKPIASTLLMKMNQEGLLSIHDSIKDYIPKYESYYAMV